MRMGKVQLLIYYAIDLDNPRQIEVAKDFIVEDVNNAVKHNEVADYFEIVEDASLNESHISNSIIECSICNYEHKDYFGDVK